MRERYDEWFHDSPENSPLWASRVLGQFPIESTNALFPLAWLEAARRPGGDRGGDIVIGIDPAGPGHSVAVACAGGAIIDTMISTASDARGPIIAFLRKHGQRLRITKIDSAGLGWYLLQHVRDAGFRCEGINVGSAANDKERFVNLKAERYWYLREAFQKGQVSGLSDDMLAELAAISYLIDSHGKTAIESKEGVRSELGRSPDLAESLMIALGEPTREPWTYTRVGNDFTFGGQRSSLGPPRTGREQADLEDGLSPMGMVRRLGALTNARWQGKPLTAVAPLRWYKGDSSTPHMGAGKTVKDWNWRD